MRVLLVEDERAMSQSIELMLKSEGFTVYATDLGQEAVDLAKIYEYDLILLDLNLPDMSGSEVLRTLRVGKVNTPIMILSGTSEIDTKVKTLGGGADEYMTKPFHREELVARIHAVIRRSQGHAQSLIKTGDITVNLDAKTADVNGIRVRLTGKEYQMLELLSLRKGSTLTKEMFLPSSGATFPPNVVRPIQPESVYFRRGSHLVSARDLGGALVVSQIWRRRQDELPFQPLAQDGGQPSGRLAPEEDV